MPSRHAPPAPVPGADGLRAENAALEGHLRAAREMLARHQEELVRTRRQLADLEEAHHRLGAEAAELAAQQGHLATLYVAAASLHTATEPQALLRAVQEVIINLVGSEAWALLRVGEDGSTLTALDSFGVDERFLPRTVLADAALRGAVESGRSCVRPDDAPHASAWAACIPLSLAGRVVAVIAVRAFLPQKLAVAGPDHDLFDLLATQAAVALRATGLLQDEGAWSGAGA